MSRMDIDKSGGLASPGVGGFFCLWRSDGVVWFEENAVSGLVEESCGVRGLSEGCE